MFNLTIENLFTFGATGNVLAGAVPSGKKIKLTDFSVTEHGYTVTLQSYNGFQPPPATVNTVPSAIYNGERLTGTKLSSRTITLVFALEGNLYRARQAFYTIAGPSAAVRLTYDDHSATPGPLTIDGIVQTCAASVWDKTETLTMTVICPDPYLKAGESVASFDSSTSGDAHLYATVQNNGVGGIPVYIQFTSDSNENGCEIAWTWRGSGHGAPSMTKTLQIGGTATVPVAGFPGIAVGDVVKISTEPGNLYVKIDRDGTETDVTGFCAAQDGLWPELENGSTTIGIAVGTDPADVKLATVRFTEKEVGV